MKSIHLTNATVALMGVLFCNQALAAGILVEGEFRRPESVEYYAAEDVYLVTNINGSPDLADDNGFISKISPEGELLQLKWLDAASPEVHLDAPKGTAIVGDILYVADMDNVHRFKLPDGKQLPSVNIKGSVFLNGLTTGENGSVYVSDSGMTWSVSEGGFVSTTTDALYQVHQDGTYSVVYQDKDMGWPNGLLKHKNGEMTVVTYGTGEAFRLDKSGKRHNLPKPPSGGLDGLVEMEDGSWITSSWSGKAIYRYKDGNYSIVLDKVTSPSDIGFDPKRNRLLIPLFMVDKVLIYPL
jgi:hypothetical protein